MLHRIAGALLLIFIGVLVALKFQNFSDQNPSASSLLKPLSKEAISQEIREGDHQIALVNYWASWCLPCLKEFPDLVKLREKYADQGLKLILISADDESKRSAAEKILRDQKVDFETYFKGDQSLELFGELYPNWNGALPSNLIITKDGKVLEAWFGETTGPEFEERIKKHL